MSYLNKIGDRLHKIAVTGLMGLTVFGAATVGLQVFQYLTRPKKNSFIMASLKRVRDFFSFKKLSLLERSSPFSNQKKPWNILKVNHIAVATNDLEKCINFYKNSLGAMVSDPVQMPEHGVTTVFVDLMNTKIELLHPIGSESPIEKFLMKNPSGGMHHICLEVDNLQNAITELKLKNVKLLGDEPKIGAHGKPVMFLHPKDCGGVLIELEEA